MAISVVQTATNASNPPCTFASNVTAGNTVILVACYYTTSGTPATASGVKLGGSAVTGTVAFFDSGATGGVNSASDGGNVASVSIWMLPNCPGSQKAVDITTTGSNIGQVAYEVAGLGATPTLDKSTSGSGITSATIDSGSTGAITSAPEFIVAGSMIFSGAGAGAPSGFTYVHPSGDLWAGYQIAASSGGSYDWQQTSAGNPWAAALVTIGLGGASHTATAALTVTPSFSAAPTRGRFRTGALTVTPSFSAARTRGRNRTAALTVTPSFSAARTRGHYRTAALTVAPSFGNSRVRGHYRTGALAVHPSFSAAHIVGHARTSALTVIPSLYAVGSKPPPVVLAPAQVMIAAAGPSAAVADVGTGAAVLEIASLASPGSQAVPVQGLHPG